MNDLVIGQRDRYVTEYGISVDYLVVGTSGILRLEIMLRQSYQAEQRR